MSDAIVMEFEAITDSHFRQALGRFPSGVTVITAMQDGQLHGMTCSAFLSVSLRPPLVLVSVGKNTQMHGVLQAAKTFGVSILARDQAHWSNHFAGRPHHEPPSFREFADQSWVDDACVQFLLNQHSVVDADAKPLVYHTGAYGEVARH